jgi:Fe-S cluster assembly protein SufD
MSAAFESLLALRSETLDRLREGEADWIGRLRDEALAAFEEQGFPTRRLEDWKSTNLAPLEAISFERVGSPEQNPVVVTGDGVPELRFVDGRLETANAQAENLPGGVHLASLAETRRQAPEMLEGHLGQFASPKRNAMIALQTAFIDDGAVLSIDAGVELDTPIRLVFSTSGDSKSPPGAAFPRLLVIAGERSCGTISVECESDAPGLTALVAEFHLAAGARFEYVQVQDEHAERIHFTSAHARLECGASFDSHVFSLSPGLIRSELEISLAEPGAETRMRGFYLGRGDGHVDHFTTVDHAAESCTSDEEYRGVLGDRSDGVFRGRVIVRPDAQKTDARQSNPNLLISEHASVDSKPQLEIYADDIRASHGSTIGQLDPDALFFLRARGIDVRAARLLLTRAFAHKIVDGIANESLRASISNRVDVALAALETDAPSEPEGADR